MKALVCPYCEVGLLVHESNFSHMLFLMPTMTDISDSHWVVWLTGQVVREHHLRSTGCGFKSRPPSCRVQPWASCLCTCSSVTKYNLVPANRQWCTAAGEVTAGLVEINGSLPPGLWLRSPVGRLPRTGISSGTLRSFQVLDCLYLYPLSHGCSTITTLTFFFKSSFHLECE